jgi:rSAM/selenodomain-associated transferase 2
MTASSANRWNKSRTFLSGPALCYQEWVVSLSIVVPTLDAERTLARTLDSLASGAGIEVVVADGGSRDRTAEIARTRGARVISCERGRGTQLARGADAATGEWLLFLHADTELALGWSAAVGRFMADPGNLHRAAAFRFRLDDPTSAARRLEALVAWRCRVLALPYGDQGLLISRTFFDALGGYREVPLMEDVDLVRRIGRHRLTLLDAAATSSAMRYRRGGYVRRPAQNIFCLALYFAGVPPRWIARLYG